MKSNLKIIDSHIHSFSKTATDSPSLSKYVPPTKDISDYIEATKSKEIIAAVLIQASVDGTDNSRILDILKSSDLKIGLRAVVMLDKYECNLEQMNCLGVRAARLQDGKAFGKPQLHKIKEISQQIAKYNWHIELNTRAESLSALKNIVLGLPSEQSLVLDHCAHINPYISTDKPDLYELLDTGKVWIKLCPVRISKTSSAYDEVLMATIHEIATRYSERCIWGSDWPFVMLKEPLPRIDYMLNQFKRIFNNQLSNKIFYKNPKKLYGF